MGDIEIRRLREEDFPAAARVEGFAFGEQPTVEEIAVFRAGFNVDRTFCAVEDGILIATASALDMELTLPGNRLIPVAALTWVAVLPSHTRRGVFRRLMKHQLDDIRLRGDAVSVLLASEAGIYGRFGYGPATHVLSFRLERPQAKMATYPGVRGRMVLIDPAAAPSILPEVYDTYRRRRPGAMSRHPGWWTEYLHDMEHHRERAGKMFHAVHENEAGARDGYVSYRIKQNWVTAIPRNKLTIVELVALDAGVRARLWDYCLSIDLIGTILFSRGQVDDSVRWLLADPRSLQVSGLADDLWVRLLDVPRALAGREYQSAGDLVFEVTDDSLPGNSGRYRLEVQTARAEAHCAATALDPGLALSVTDLGSAYLGGVTFQTLAAAGRVRELQPGALVLADGMFATDFPPYCATMF